MNTAASLFNLDDEAALAAFADAAIGGGLAPEVEALLTQAGLLRHDAPVALALLTQARAAAPRHPLPLIALYRFHFYGHQLALARQVGEDALALARTALGPNFGDLPPSDEDARGNASVRFYLFLLKGLAYLNLRLGHLPEAQLLLGELRRLDPQDHVGGALLWHVLRRNLLADELPPGELTGDYPVRGWGKAAP
jgi:hypothetical protein